MLVSVWQVTSHHVEVVQFSIYGLDGESLRWSYTIQDCGCYFGKYRVWMCWNVWSMVGCYSKGYIRYITGKSSLRDIKQEDFWNDGCWKKNNYFLLRTIQTIRRRRRMLPDCCRPGRRSAGWWSTGSPHLPTHPAPPGNKPSKERCNKVCTRDENISLWQQSWSLVPSGSAFTFI